MPFNTAISHFPSPKWRLKLFLFLTAYFDFLQPISYYGALGGITATFLHYYNYFRVSNSTSDLTPPDTANDIYVNVIIPHATILAFDASIAGLFPLFRTF